MSWIDCGPEHGTSKSWDEQGREDLELAELSLQDAAHKRLYP
jgi:hypothetical protein